MSGIIKTTKVRVKQIFAILLKGITIQIVTLHGK
jgi:hypothetical protein